MQWKKNKWLLLITFLIGGLVSFITTRFDYFDIKKELDVPGLFLGFIGILAGIYIAESIQKRLNISQNRYSFLIERLNQCWNEFSNISKVIVSSDNISVDVLSKINQEVIHKLSFIKTIFNAFKLNQKCLDDLEKEIEYLEEEFNNNSIINNNIIDYSLNKTVVKNKIELIDKSFSMILIEIQNIT